MLNYQRVREKAQGPKGWCPKFPGCPGSEVQEAFDYRCWFVQKGMCHWDFNQHEAFNKPIEHEDLTIKNQD